MTEQKIFEDYEHAIQEKYYFSFLKKVFIYLFEREREEERERERISRGRGRRRFSTKQGPQCEAQSQNPGIMT